MTHTRKAALLLAVLAFLAAPACRPKSSDGPRRYAEPFVAMGTDGIFTVVAPDEETAGQAMEQALAEVQQVESLMSTYRPESDVSKLNAADPDAEVAVAPPTAEVLREAARMHEVTGGAFDITYAPLRTLWRRAAEKGEEPTEEQIKQTLALVGADRIAITDAGEVSLPAGGMEVDLGGIAKGFAIDRAAEAMQRAGASGGIVDVGHDLRLFGKKETGGKWRVEVHRPPGVDQRFILEVGPCAVTTSGDYARGFLVGNKWFSHIIDPRTGRPATDVTSVTVVGPDAVRADALATALSVMGAQEGLALVERLPEFECLFMTKLQRGNIAFKMSSGFGSLVVEE